MVSDVIPVGTLVRLIPERVANPYAADAARDHGYLYIVLRHDDKWDEYWCRSLATGDELNLLPRELETMEQADRRIPEGTLVRVKPEALKGQLGESNTALTSEHGWLWFVERHGATDEYYCRSLATGERDVLWLDSEITTRKEKTNERVEA